MFALFPEFGARIRPQDLWPFLISETGLKFLIWTQGKFIPVTLSSAEASLCWGEAGGKEKGSAPFPSSHRPPRAFNFSIIAILKGYPAETSAEERVPVTEPARSTGLVWRGPEMGVEILTCIQLSVKLNQQPLEILEIFVSMIWVGRGMHSARGAKITKCHVIRTKERKHTSLGENERGLMYDELLRDRVKEFQNSPHSRSKTSESSENIPGKTKLEKHLWRAKSFWGQRVRPHHKNDNNDHCNGKTSWSVGPQAKFS